MNREDIIRMAREAGGTEMQPYDYGAKPDKFILRHSELERFFQAAYAAGAAAEREACAYRAGIALLGADRGLTNCVDQAIRARGQA